MIRCKNLFSNEFSLPVALSRAKEGLYILGNAEQLASKSQMWNEIVDMLSEREALGPALPIVCHRHPNTVQWVSNPESIRRFAPDGKISPLKGPNFYLNKSCQVDVSKAATILSNAVTYALTRLACLGFNFAIELTLS